MDRRSVMRVLAASAAASVVGRLAGGGYAAYGQNSETKPGSHGDPMLRIDRIGLQLYTVRRELARNLDATLAAIAAAGVTEVEFAGYYDRDPAAWRSLLGQHGLSAPATHVGLPENDDGWYALFDHANAMGHRYVIIPSVPGNFTSSIQSWQRLSERLNKGAERARAEGLSLAWHNHDREFAAIEGTSGFEILTTETDRNLLLLELDIYWAVKAGQDPLSIISRWPGRVVSCHVKDAGPAPERKMMDVGDGTIDFGAILGAGRKQGLAHWFIEHDNPVDPLATVSRSVAAMKKL